MTYMAVIHEEVLGTGTSGGVAGPYLAYAAGDTWDPSLLALIQVAPLFTFGVHRNRQSKHRGFEKH